MIIIFIMEDVIKFCRKLWILNLFFRTELIPHGLFQRSTTGVQRQAYLGQMSTWNEIIPA